MKSLLKKLAIGSTFGLVAMMGGEQAEAATTVTADIDVSVDVNANCVITASPMAFGTYDPADVAANVASVTGTAGEIQVNCSDNIGFQVGVNAGANGGADLEGDGQLALTDGTYFLGYDLLLGAAGPVINTSSILDNVDAAGVGDGYVAGNPGDQTYTIDGSIPAGQGVIGGTYLDTVTASLTY